MKDIKINPNSSPELVLCVPQGWEAYISCEFYELHLHLVQLGWTRLIIDETSDAEILTALSFARFVLLWEAYEFLERNEERLRHESKFSSSDTHKIFFCDDSHFFTKQRRQQRLRAFNWADTILTTYHDKLSEWYPEISKSKIKWTPHSAATCFYPIFSPSSNRILLSGSRTWPYPFRQFCQTKLPTEICDVIDHPGYPGYPGDIANQSKSDLTEIQRIGREKYADLLRSYPAMLVCGSIFNYLVAKVFEGMSAGCLIVCDRTSLGSQLSLLGFVEGEHFVGTDIFNVQEDAAEVRNKFLHKNIKWKTIVEKASIKVREEHSTKIRAEQIHLMCINK